MKKIVLILFINSFIYAQVGVGTITPNAALEINSALPSPSTHKAGLLPPIVALTATNSIATTTVGVNVINPNGGGNPATGTIVYNTNTSSVGVNQVTPGYYFFNGTIWEKISTGANKNWQLLGNAGTTLGTNFIGTTDNVGLDFRTNNNFAATIGNAGRIGIGNNDQTWAKTFSYSSSAAIDALVGYSDVAGGTGIYGYSIGANGFGVYGSNNDASGIGVLGNNSLNGVGIQGQASGPNGVGSIGFAGGNNAIGVFGVANGTNGRGLNGQSSGINGIGVGGFTTGSGNATNTPTALYGFASGISSIGVFGAASGINATSSAFGIYGNINNTTTTGNTDAAAIAGINSNATQGLGYAGPNVLSTNSAIVGISGSVASKRTSIGALNSQSYYFGVMGELLVDSNITGAAIQRRSGGVIGIGVSGTWASSGYRNSAGNDYGIYSTSALTTGTGRLSSQAGIESSGIGIGINGGVMGGFINGQQYGLVTKGQHFGAYIVGNTFTNKPITQIETINNNKVISYATTSATVDVTIRGKGKLINGVGFVSFDTSFIQSAELDEENLTITITATGNTNGIFIEKTTNNGFYVKENMNGNHSVTFNWTAVSIRKGYKNGVVISNEILDPNWENNMSEVMRNENDTTSEAQPIYFDGAKIRFSEIPNQSNSLFNKADPIKNIKENHKTNIKEATIKKNEVKFRSSQKTTEE